MAFYRSIFTVGILTILSRFVGFIREILIARELGASAITDAIKIAIKFPSLCRRIFAEGAFNASFVPMFSELLSKPDGQNKAHTFAEEILSWLMVILCCLIVIVEITMPYIFIVTCPGFDTERLTLVIEFTRITFPFIFFISLTAFYSGILNSIDRFIFVASSPVFGNIFIVAFFISMANFSHNLGKNFCIAILGCGIVQFLWVLLPSMGSGYGFKIRQLTLSPHVRHFFKRLAPAAFGAGVVQINIVIDMMIASNLPKGYISYLDFAERLNQLPLSVIGTAISTVLLPLMSRQVSQNKIEDSIITQNESIKLAMLLTFPAMCGLIIWSTPIVGMIYQYGKFTLHDTILTSNGLYAFAFGLPAYILIKIFSTTFFSHKDTKTPVQVAIACVVLNLGLNLALIKPFLHVGLAMATAISAWVNALILCFILKRRSLFVITQELLHYLMRLLASLIIAIPVLIFSKPYLLHYINVQGWMKGAIISLFCIIAMSVFALTAYMCGVLRTNGFNKKREIVTSRQ